MTDIKATDETDEYTLRFLRVQEREDDSKWDDQVFEYRQTIDLENNYEVRDIVSQFYGTDKLEERDYNFELHLDIEDETLNLQKIDFDDVVDRFKASEEGEVVGYARTEDEKDETVPLDIDFDELVNQPYEELIGRVDFSRIGSF